MTAEAAAAVTEALSDPLARVRLARGRSPFDLGFAVAVKTGTSSGYRDTWAIGYTAERTVAVWLGNADGAPTHELTGASGAGPLFADVMRRAMRDVAQRAPLWDAQLLTSVQVCPLSGQPAGPACPDRVLHKIARGSAGRAGGSAGASAPCHVHRAAVRRRAGEVPFACHEDGGEVIAVFGPEYTAWLEAQAPGAPGRSPHGVPWYPAAAVPGCADAQAGAPALLRLHSPLSGTVFLSDLGSPAPVVEIPLRAEVEGGDPGLRRDLDRVEFLVDGDVVASSAWPFQTTARVGPGDHEIVARPVRARLAVRSAPTHVTVR
jgi:penicillin-binding protein 1C